ncbi:hypothetical protein PO909_005576 [Leuciscus waleckii]
MTIAALWLRLRYLERGGAPSLIPRSSASSTQQKRPTSVNSLGDLRITVRGNPLSQLAGPYTAVPVVSFGALPDDQMSVAASEGELMSSGDEDSAALPPSGVPALAAKVYVGIPPVSQDCYLLAGKSQESQEGSDCIERLSHAMPLLSHSSIANGQQCAALGRHQAFPRTLCPTLEPVPPAIHEMKSHGVRPGHIALLRCEAAAVPSPVFEWYKGEKRINMGQGIDIKNLNSRSVLTVKNMTQDRYGNYTCVAVNRLGTANASVPLIRDRQPLRPVLPSKACRMTSTLLARIFSAAGQAASYTPWQRCRYFKVISSVSRDGTGGYLQSKKLRILHFALPSLLHRPWGDWLALWLKGIYGSCTEMAIPKSTPRCLPLAFSVLLSPMERLMPTASQAFKHFLPKRSGPQRVAINRLREALSASHRLPPHPHSSDSSDSSTALGPALALLAAPLSAGHVQGLW